MRPTRRALPGMLRPLKGYGGWKKEGKHRKRTIEEKREAVIRGLERSLRGEKGASTLEQFDPKLGTPVIRVLYASRALPIFDGEAFAAIDPQCDRGQLWGAVIEELRAGAYDREIEEVAGELSRTLETKRAVLKAV